MRRAVLPAALLLAALTCLYTWPLPAYATSAVAHDRGDPLLVTWILWWTSHTVPLTSAWWNAPAFYPSSGVLAFSENLLSLAPIAAPIVHATGSPILAYNAAFLSSYVFSGLAAYFLAWVLTRCHVASFAAAVAYAFAPYRLSHIQHLQLLSSYWMPVAMAALHLFAASPRWRWAVLFAAAWALQALASGYYLFFLSTFVGLWLIWFVPGRVSPRDAARLLIAWVVAGLLLAPILYGYRTVHASYGFKRSPVEMVNYSADVAGLVSASPDSRLWGWLHARVGSESEQFPGLVLLLLLLGSAAVGWRARKARASADAPPGAPRGTIVFYGGSAVLMWLFSLGPVVKLNGTPTGIPGPYALLAQLPGFDGMRVPARFWMLTVLCLSVCAAFAIARIHASRTRRIVAALAIGGFLLDAWPRAFPVVAAPGTRVTTSQARARLGLPLHEAETETMFGAIPQSRAVFNGYSGYAAPQHAALRDLLEQHDPAILDRLAAAEPIEVIVESAGDADGRWNEYVRSHPRALRLQSGPDWTAYEIGVTNALPPAPVTGPIVPVARIEASANAKDIGAVLDQDLDTRWHTVPQRGGETITVTLDAPRRVSGIVLCLGTYAAQYPRALEVAVSADARSWTPVYTGATALETYDAALRSPREVPITVPIRRDGVRFLRLRQTGGDPRRGWTIVELRVIG
ncbi:MAG TPA: discoidin domain-containing protein [Vicinamibacterales bacterium]|nr:discoidin domain-containing protein [Vicinamibacterales bacterium]